MTIEYMALEVPEEERKAEEKRKAKERVMTAIGCFIAMAVVAGSIVALEVAVPMARLPSLILFVCLFVLALAAIMLYEPIMKPIVEYISNKLSSTKITETPEPEISVV